MTYKKLYYFGHVTITLNYLSNNYGFPHFCILNFFTYILFWFWKSKILGIILGKIIGYFENYDPSDSAALYEAHGYAGVLSACTLVLAILHHLYFYHVQCAGMRLRVAMCHMIYRKVSVTWYLTVYICWSIRSVLKLASLMLY